MRSCEALQDAYVFLICADADPDVLSRIANQFNSANVAPRRLTFDADESGAARLELHLCGVTSSLAELIRRRLSQLTCVWSVDVTPSA